MTIRLDELPQVADGKSYDYSMRNKQVKPMTNEGLPPLKRELTDKQIEKIQKAFKKAKNDAQELKQHRCDCCHCRAMRGF